MREQIRIKTFKIMKAISPGMKKKNQMNDEKRISKQSETPLVIGLILSAQLDCLQ